MCLYDKKRFRFTFKPIKVYKVVTVFNISPIQKACIKKKNSIPIKCLSSPKYIYYGLYEFGEGFFHAFISKEIATNFIKRLLTTTPYSVSELKIVEGYIPAFTRYAVDEWNEEICARQMNFNL